MSTSIRIILNFENVLESYLQIRNRSDLVSAPVHLESDLSYQRGQHACVLLRARCVLSMALLQISGAVDENLLGMMTVQTFKVLEWLQLCSEQLCSSFPK